MTVTTDQDGRVRPDDQADLLSVGQHCSFEECCQLDFLPFKCSGCSKIFCLEHRTASSHQCSAPGDGGEGATQAIVCPVCARAVKVSPSEDPNVTLDRHMRDACDPSNYAKVHKKKKCPVKNCKEKLTSINSFECKQCRATVCLKHRLADDHACPGKPPQVSRSNSLLRGPWSSFFSSSSGAPPASAKSTQGKGGAAPKVSVPQSGGKLSSIARKVTGSVQSQLQEYRASHQSNRGSAPPQPVAAAKAPSGGAQERCPQCGSMFPSVQALIDHAAAVHLDGWSSGAGLRTAPTGGGEFERCPHCSAQFGDPVELVRHVESMHGGRQGSEVCVLC